MSFIKKYFSVTYSTRLPMEALFERTVRYIEYSSVPCKQDISDSKQ